MTRPFLEVAGLSVGRRRKDGMELILDDASFEMAAGEVLGIVGESGSGKSTLCRALARILPEGLSVTSGTAVLDGQPLIGPPSRQVHRRRKARVGMVFQDPLAALDPVIRIGNQIVEAYRVHVKVRREQARQYAYELLEQLGISESHESFERYPHEFSGGQQQRIVIAIALASGADLLLADEPTSSLDVQIQTQILSLLRALADERGLGVVFVSHDYAAVAELCSRVMVMYAGRIVESGPTRELITNPGHPYGAALLEALPSLDRRVARLSVIPGRHPTPEDGLKGCPFHPRCDYTTDVCQQTRVELVSLTSNHSSACLRVGAFRLSRSGPYTSSLFELIAFNGTVMRGEPKHENLEGAEFLGKARTAAKYRLFSIGDEYPAMIEVSEDGVQIWCELYKVPVELWPSIHASEPPGLEREVIELADGRTVWGMVGTPDLIQSRGTDISRFGGWKEYRAASDELRASWVPTDARLEEG